MTKLTESIKKEINRSSTSTTDAIFQRMLKRDLENGDLDTDRVNKVKKKYNL